MLSKKEIESIRKFNLRLTSRLNSLTPKDRDRVLDLLDKAYSSLSIAIEIVAVASFPLRKDKIRDILEANKNDIGGDLLRDFLGKELDILAKVR